MGEAGGTEAGTTLAVVAAMQTEIRPFVRALSLRPGTLGGVAVRTGTRGTTRVVATVVGVGPVVSRRNTERLLDATPIDRVLMIGVAGGVAPDMGVGDMLVPEVVRDRETGAEFRSSPPHGVEAAGTLLTGATLSTGDDNLAALRAQGVAAVDMETAAVAAACEARGCPWSAYRAMSDTLDGEIVDDWVMELVRPDGGTDLGGVVRLVLRRPWIVVRMARLGMDTKKGVDAITRAALHDVGAA